MRQNIKIRRKKQIGALLAVCFIAMLSTTVYAGDINEAEQLIINYYNGTFTYEGKTYVASEAAKASAYNKLIADDVDLTTSQAKTAIRNASQNVKKGIDEGYLIEVTETPPAENQNTEVPATEEGQNSGGSTEDGSDTEKPTDGSGDVGGTGEENEPGNENTPGKKPDDKPEEVEKPNKPVDVNGLIGDAFQNGEQYADVQTGLDGDKKNITGQTTEIPKTAITVEQYVDGKLTAVTEDGNLLFQGSLPIKNTGYYTGTIKVVVCGMGILFSLTIIAAIGYIVAKKSKVWK